MSSRVVVEDEVADSRRGTLRSTNLKVGRGYDGDIFFWGEFCWRATFTAVDSSKSWSVRCMFKPNCLERLGFLMMGEVFLEWKTRGLGTGLQVGQVGGVFFYHNW